MEIRDFEDILSQHGIKYRKSGQSIVCQECPVCGDRLFKVHFNAATVNGRAREKSDPVLGKCFRGSCGAGFSSKSFLIASGLDEGLVEDLHNTSHLTAEDLEYWSGVFQDGPSDPAPVPAKPVDPPKATEPTDLSGFLPLSAWPDHPVALYAKKRGATPENANILLDPLEQAVVFVVLDQQIPVGWQKRFLNPSPKKPKTKTSAGFQKTGFVLRFERPAVPQVVCEGPFSALSGWHYGFDAVCTFGANPSTKQLQEIADKALRTKLPVAIGYDNDDAGAQGGKQIERFMHRLGIKTFSVFADGYNDLNDAWMAGAMVQTTKPKTEQWVLDDIPTI